MMLKEDDLDQYCLLKTTPSHLREVAVGTDMTRQPDYNSSHEEIDSEQMPSNADPEKISEHGVKLTEKMPFCYYPPESRAFSR